MNAKRNVFRLCVPLFIFNTIERYRAVHDFFLNSCVHDAFVIQFSLSDDVQNLFTSNPDHDEFDDDDDDPILLYRRPASRFNFEDKYKSAEDS